MTGASPYEPIRCWPTPAASTSASRRRCWARCPDAVLSTANRSSGCRAITARAARSPACAWARRCWPPAASWTGSRPSLHWVAQNLYASLFPSVMRSATASSWRTTASTPAAALFPTAHLVLHLIEEYTDRDTAIWCAKYSPAGLEPPEPVAVFRVHGAEGACRRGGARRAGLHRRPLHGKDHGRGTGRAARPGPAHLERRFRQATGNSIVEYVQRVRVEAAKKRLETSRKSVAEVMYEVGYNDTKAFRDIFSKYCGMSPVGYREALSLPIARGPAPLSPGSGTPGHRASRGRPIRTDGGPRAGRDWRSGPATGPSTRGS